MSTTTDIEVYEPGTAPDPILSTLIPSKNPEDFIREAGTVARALVKIVNDQKMYTQMGKDKHLHVDAWTSLGSLLGSVGGRSVFAVPDGDPEPIEINGVQGVKARMKAMTIDGHIVGGGTGFCMRDEQNWKNKPFYALAGMAETRATSRALRKPLGFIVRLAGYAATGAEEMPAPEVAAENVPFEPTHSSFQAPTTATPKKRSQAQNKQMRDLIQTLIDRGVPLPELINDMQGWYGVVVTSELSPEQADDYIRRLKARVDG